MVDINCGSLTISQGPGVLARLRATLRRWRRRIRERTELARFDERSLRDIGVSPAQARYETSKPFWRD
ncbi:MAG TPA: DUF1127 domain-containing protein [Stellaceae bacterium]|nr:DUF1127 domain-containing protein [Stellaceae bacterium]